MRAPEFEAMIGPARLYPQLWRLILGFLLIACLYIGGIAILFGGLYVALGPYEFGALITGIQARFAPFPVVVLLASFLAALIGPVVAAAALHGRGPGTLFGPFDELRRGFLTVLAVTLPLYAALVAVGGVFEPYQDNLSWNVWLRWLPVALPLILVQVTAEEAIFRGYLQQQLAARFASRVVWMYLPALVFAALHYQPGAPGTIWLAMVATFVFAVIAADLTERTGSLGAAIGLHFVNNVFGLTVVSLGGTITGLARWTTPYDLGDAGPAMMSLGFNIAFLALVWRLIRWALDR